MSFLAKYRRLAGGRTEDTLASHALTIAPIETKVTCGTVFSLFERDRELIAVPIVDNGWPVGLMNRQDMMTLWSSRYGRALYEHRPITRIMDRQPLIVEADMNADELQARIADEESSALMRGFILTRRGLYFGMGSALALLRVSVLRGAKRAIELERARDAAERANRSKSQFLATVSHELRTPLNAIIGFSDLIMSEVFGPVAPARYGEYMVDIHTSGVLLLSLISDILDMAKIEAGKFNLHEERLNLEMPIESSIRLVRERALHAKVTVKVELEPNLPGFLGDERAIRQILLNLLSNSIKFTPKGGSVTVRAASVADGHLELSVADTGIGIASEHIKLVLEPFGQVTSAFTRNHDGTGLGLPLVKALAELHGAHFDIESRLGRGTTVRLTFPASRVVRETRAPAPLSAVG